MSDLKQGSNRIINLHLITAVVISVLLYFFYDHFFAISFAAGSMAWNMYLRLLQNAFWIALAAKLNLQVENKTLLIIFSAIRTLIIASIFAFFILKLKFNLIALGSAFICYNIIVIVGVVIENPTLTKKN
jgi:hypothetical protein